MGGAIQSISEHGTEGTLIVIECHVSNGLPTMQIVGLANRAVDEARERVRSAFASSGLELPRKRIIINLAPADIPKDNTGFDLAIATAIWKAAGLIQKSPRPHTIIIGELGLDGSVRPVRGIIGKLIAGYHQGGQHFFIPFDNLSQAVLVPNIALTPISHLKDLYGYFNNSTTLHSVKGGQKLKTSSLRKPTNADFAEVIGQGQAKRALEVAAAGGHNILLSGPPGAGKTMLARALPSILPPLSQHEVLEVTQLHSLASNRYEAIITEPPFRAPHHTASDMAIIGGGAQPRPGEISLAHRGVLFFDEFPEFRRSCLEALRQPLEDRRLTITRAKESITFPAAFILVATANPCPCGFYGSVKKCECKLYQVQRYRQKLSGPILDRIDLCIHVEEVPHERLLHQRTGEEPSERIALRVLNARQRQARRFQTAHLLNSAMDNPQVKRWARLSGPAKQALNQAAQGLSLSARAYMRSIKVARTIADLADSPVIEADHVIEALQYRQQSRAITDEIS